MNISINNLINPKKIYALNFGANRLERINTNTPAIDTFTKTSILLKEDENEKAVKVKPYETEAKFNAENFFKRLKYENAQAKYIKIYTDSQKPAESKILDNKEAQQYAQQLDNLTLKQQKEVIKIFCEETGFPNLKKVRNNMENEILSAIHELALKENFEIKFAGYDANCSLGRNIALPGSDIDALFMIIDYTDKPEWFAGAMRWKLKNLINQRLVKTPAGHLPEVLSENFINDGLNLASFAFKSCNFSQEELEKFRENLSDSSNDFVKSAEFNIRLAQTLPDDIQTRDKFYKTAMLVELIREGVILENNFSDEFINKIKNSKLYKYSNIIKMQGFSDKPKQKYLNRLKLVHDFNKLSPQEQFSVIKSLIYSSLNIYSENYENLFSNISEGQDEMGNILEMYDLLMHSKSEI